jgi:hypothetical protein
MCSRCAVGGMFFLFLNLVGFLLLAFLLVRFTRCDNFRFNKLNKEQAGVPCTVNLSKFCIKDFCVAKNSIKRQLVL